VLKCVEVFWSLLQCVVMCCRCVVGAVIETYFGEISFVLQMCYPVLQ